MSTFLYGSRPADSPSTSLRINSRAYFSRSHFDTSMILSAGKLPPSHEAMEGVQARQQRKIKS